ncbi:hypothetical protein KY345_04300 [Candidatus Woesearchaeota archaeon]|nr:hypothetical protein [Candidatus Woesearchaeota archaeon]
MNKKAQAQALLWIIRIIILVAVVGVLHYLMVLAMNNSLKTADTEIYIAHNRIMYSLTGLAYTSLATGRTYPGIIDIELFDQGRLNKTNLRKIPVRVLLSTIKDNTINREIYYDKERFEQLKPLVFSKKYDLINKTQYVLIRDQEQLKPGKLIMEMVVSR